MMMVAVNLINYILIDEARAGHEWRNNPYLWYSSAIYLAIHYVVLDGCIAYAPPRIYRTFEVMDAEPRTKLVRFA